MLVASVYAPLQKLAAAKEAQLDFDSRHGQLAQFHFRQKLRHAIILFMSTLLLSERQERKGKCVYIYIYIYIFISSCQQAPSSGAKPHVHTKAGQDCWSLSVSITAQHTPYFLSRHSSCHMKYGACCAAMLTDNDQ